MVPRSARLTRRAFEYAFRRGKRTHTAFFQLIYTPTPSRGYQVSAVVPKKVAKTAVVRNRLRRRIYHIARKTLEEQGYTGSYIFITKPDIRTVSQKELGDSIGASIRSLFGQ